MTRNKKELPALVRNRKALHNYNIVETLEVGLVLEGPEVKSIRAGGMNLGESYVRVIHGELWLLGAHISPYVNAGYAAPDPLRVRKLLASRREITRLGQKTRETGSTLVLLAVYLNHKGRIKGNLALVTGKKMHDKRDTLKAQVQKREMERTVKNKRV